MGSTLIVFSAEQAAAALWTYGEDALIDKTLALSDGDLRRVWQIAGRHWRQDHGLPLTTRLVLDKVTAFACIEHFEGRLRPLARERRRSLTTMPAHLRNARPVRSNAVLH